MSKASREFKSYMKEMNIEGSKEKRKNIPKKYSTLKFYRECRREDSYLFKLDKRNQL